MLTQPYPMLPLLANSKLLRKSFKHFFNRRKHEHLLCLKENLHELFCLNWFDQTKPPGPPVHDLKHFKYIFWFAEVSQSYGILPTSCQ
jgi:hypothetical protein